MVASGRSHFIKDCNTSKRQALSIFCSTWNLWALYYNLFARKIKYFLWAFAINYNLLCACFQIKSMFTVPDSNSPRWHNSLLFQLFLNQRKPPLCVDSFNFCRLIYFSTKRGPKFMPLRFLAVLRLSDRFMYIHLLAFFWGNMRQWGLYTFQYFKRN